MPSLCRLHASPQEHVEVSPQSPSAPPHDSFPVLAALLSAPAPPGCSSWRRLVTNTPQRQALARGLFSRALLGLVSGRSSAAGGLISCSFRRRSEWGIARDNGARVFPSLASEAQSGQVCWHRTHFRHSGAPHRSPPHIGQAKCKRHDGKRPQGGRNLCLGRIMSNSLGSSGPQFLSSIN